MTQATFDLDGLDLLRTHHPAWKLLRADHAPFILGFLQRTFVAEQLRQLPESDVLRRLDDHLFTCRAQADEGSYPRTAREYLTQWAADDTGWVRLSYRNRGDDEPVCDLTPAAEQAIEWIASLRERPFVGTEGRLLTVFALLREITSGAEMDPARRIADLERRRQDLDEDIARIRCGELSALSPIAIRDRFQILADNARALLSDLRAVQQRFHGLDRAARSRIAQWDGAKGGLLGELLISRDAITGSDEGQSFRAFWDFLMNPQRQEEFDHLLHTVLSLPAIRESRYDPRLSRVRFDWLAAGEQAQRTVALLSQQLRRFLDDRAWLENRRIAELIQEITSVAVVLRSAPPRGIVMEVDALAPELLLPLERPLYTPTIAPELTETTVDLGISDADDSVLYSQHVIDLDALTRVIQGCLVAEDHVTLAQVVERHPLRHGLAELIGYLRLATDTDHLLRSTLDEDLRDSVIWLDGSGDQRRATVPRIIFHR